MLVRALTATAVVTAALVAGVAPAQAAAPEVTVAETDRTVTFPDTLCGFEFRAHVSGGQRTTTYRDAEGNITRTVIHLNGFFIVYSTADHSVTVPLAGPFVIEPNGDGTTTVTIPGNDGRIVVPGEGLLHGDVGRIVYIAPEGDRFTQLEVLSTAGHYGGDTDFVSALCTALSS